MTNFNVHRCKQFYETIKLLRYMGSAGHIDICKRTCCEEKRDKCFDEELQEEDFAYMADEMRE